MKFNDMKLSSWTSPMLFTINPQRFIHLTGSLLRLALIGLGFFALYQTFNRTLVPLLSGAIDRHLQQIDDLAQRHSQEHQQIVTQLQQCNHQLDQLVTDVKIRNAAKHQVQ